MEEVKNDRYLSFLTEKFLRRLVFIENQNYCEYYYLYCQHIVDFYKL